MIAALVERGRRGFPAPNENSLRTPDTELGAERARRRTRAEAIIVRLRARRPQEQRVAPPQPFSWISEGLLSFCCGWAQLCVYDLPSLGPPRRGGVVPGRLLLGRQCIEVALIDEHPVPGSSSGLFDDPARLQFPKHRIDCRGC